MDDFKSLCRHLRKRYPTVRWATRVKGNPGLYALTTHRNGVYTIEFDPDLCEGGRIGWLLHEFAHVLSLLVDSGETLHGPVFAAALERVYRDYEQWVDARK